MDELKNFIQNGRQAGQNDLQIRERMVIMGWPADQIDAAFGAAGQQPAPQAPAPTIPTQPTAPPPQPLQQPQQPQQPYQSPFVQPGQMVTMEQIPGMPAPGAPGRQRRIALITVGIVVGIAAMATLLLSLADKPQTAQKQNSATSQQAPAGGYEDVIKQLIEAVQKSDKAKADSLMSADFVKAMGQDAGTESFYDACQETAAFCADLFKPEYLQKAEKSDHDYTSDTGVKGKEVRYTVKQSLDNGGGCKSESTTTLSISAAEFEGKWKIDSVSPEFKASAELCASDPAQPAS